MGLFSRLLNKKGAEAGAAIARMENKDLVEATIYGCVAVAYADGELEESELKNLQLQIEANDVFKGFQPQDIALMIDKAVALFKAGAVLGRKKAFDQIRDICRDQQQAEEAFVAMITVAQSDGQIEEAEAKILAEIGKILGGLKVETYVA